MVNQEKRGIWQYEDVLPKVAPQFRVTLGEGNTPVEKHDSSLFKLEYTNPTGSVKDRGFAYQISALKEKGINRAVLSSSGNAAISAASYCSLAGIDLTVFVSTRIHPKKLERLNKLNVTIQKSLRPKSDAIKFSKANALYNLRQSKEEIGAVGFQTLGYEIGELSNSIDAIFIPVSSATTLVGMAEGLRQKGIYPAIHIVQTTSIHSLASLFDTDFIKTDRSIADAIVARSTPRAEEILDTIKKFGGSGWVVSDQEIVKAHEWLTQKNLLCSYEGAAALAGLWKAKDKGYTYKNPLCLLTGTYYGK
ncbi:pyridoxal-phosphate dependent enzyme [Candidatus Gottesmanbacteria bacterium]|nr:pyridoxal-phosphate dependent enzyme [Candidatus Gottesmanbacteria bacterium]